MIYPGTIKRAKIIDEPTRSMAIIIVQKGIQTKRKPKNLHGLSYLHLACYLKQPLPCNPSSLRYTIKPTNGMISKISGVINTYPIMPIIGLKNTGIQFPRKHMFII
jgi:hypothetical protein